MPPREKINEWNKDKSCIVGIPMGWPRGGSLMGGTSSYAGEIQAVVRGFDTARLTDGVD